MVSNDKIERISQAFNLTATSFGLQPLKLIIANNKQLQQELVKHSMNQEQVAQASHILIFCIETDIDTIATGITGIKNGIDNIEEELNATAISNNNISIHLSSIKSSIADIESYYPDLVNHSNRSATALEGIENKT